MRLFEEFYNIVYSICASKNPKKDNMRPLEWMVGNAHKIMIDDFSWAMDMPSQVLMTAEKCNSFFFKSRSRRTSTVYKQMFAGGLLMMEWADNLPWLT